MRFEDLNCLVAVADTGSITGAAKRLFISQQAISASIKKLEEELQCALLVREKDGVSFTSKGKETLDFARKILKEKEIFCNRIRLSEENESLLVRICSTSPVTNIVLPNVIDRMEMKNQNVFIRITMKDELDELFERVNSQQCDIGLLTFNAEELLERFACYNDEMKLDVLIRDEMVSVFNRKFLQGESAQLTETDFYRCRHSLYNIIPSKMHLDSARQESVVWSNDSEFHRAMLERNGSMVLMPSLAYQYFFKSKKYVALSPFFELPIIHAAIYRKDAPEYIKEFVNMIRLEMHMK